MCIIFAQATHAVRWRRSAFLCTRNESGYFDPLLFFTKKERLGMFAFSTRVHSLWRVWVGSRIMPLLTRPSAQNPGVIPHSPNPIPAHIFPQSDWSVLVIYIQVDRLFEIMVRDQVHANPLVYCADSWFTYVYAPRYPLRLLTKLVDHAQTSISVKNYYYPYNKKNLTRSLGTKNSFSGWVKLQNWSWLSLPGSINDSLVTDLCIL